MRETVLRWLKRLGLGGGLVVALLYAVFCAYSLPSHIKVHVTGTEVTRQDVKDKAGDILTEDVRYVMAEDLEGNPHMFRNEDTGWGWPPFFKFDSGDIAAQANNFAVDGRDEIVLVTYYGFRIRMLSSFPNVTSMKSVSADYQPIPWFTIIFCVANIIALGVAVVFIRDFQNAKED
jgi:hypothetical protein